MNNTTELVVNISSVRLDRFVSDRLPDLSRAAVQRLIDDGQILVNNQSRKPSYRVQSGETISVHIPPPESSIAQPEAIPLDIIFENDDLLVVNKPAGMVVHPAAGHAAGTLVNALLAHLQTPPSAPPLLGEGGGGGVRPGIVHRLDRDTSGLIVVAKNDAAMRDLQMQFKSRRVKKTYLALVEGKITPPRGKIDAPIGRDPKHRQRMSVLTRGKTRQAVTIYRTLANLDGYTLVEAEPQTGRTHQIRVHLAFLGFPVVGDVIYAKKKNVFGLTRQFLHAWKIAFNLPRKDQRVEFTAPLPEDLSGVLDELGFDTEQLQ